MRRNSYGRKIADGPITGTSLAQIKRASAAGSKASALAAKARKIERDAANQVPWSERKLWEAK